jgi:hypothetical protein
MMDYASPRVDVRCSLPCREATSILIQVYSPFLIVLPGT